jgi:uncharacterized membrane protein
MSRFIQTTRPALWGLMAFLSLGIALVSYRYLAPNPPFMGPDIAQNLFRKPWLLLHATLAATALLVGPFQFLTRLRAKRPGVHRRLGKIYVGAGPIAQWGFGTLSVLWFIVTANALRLAMAGRIAEHRRWMIRSFAMTFAAVTLRLYLPVPPLLLHMSFIEGYRAISWLCWTLNLAAVEVFLNWKGIRDAIFRSADARSSDRLDPTLSP